MGRIKINKMDERISILERVSLLLFSTGLALVLMIVRCI